MDKVVFVSIEFEGLHLTHQAVKDPGEPNDMKTQVGLSILDTINLVLPPANAIRTYNFATGSGEYT
jgi:hypothetical protein